MRIRPDRGASQDEFPRKLASFRDNSLTLQIKSEESDKSDVEKQQVALKIILALLAVVTVSCSEDKDKKPTDDDFRAKAQACSNADFRACADEVLSRANLSEPEREALSRCDEPEAQPSNDAFEAARAAVRSSCR